MTGLLDRISDRRFEFLATILLAMAAVATAWASYQSARWHGKQAEAQSASIAARVESSKAAAVANRQVQVDVAAFTQWVDAYANRQPELTRFYRRRFREEFVPAFNAWVATRPLSNPKAPLTPFAMPQYSLAAEQRAAQLEAKAAAASHRVRVDIQRADDYVLAVVLFAVSLFFAAMSSRLDTRGARVAVLGLGFVIFLGTAIWIVTLPISVSV
jgi:hypothetical protein